MYRRICSFVLFDDGIIGDMKYFTVLPTENQCYTVTEIYEIVNENPLCAKHIYKVQGSGVTRSIFGHKTD